MKNIARWLVPAVLAAALPGCFDSNVLVRLNKDGSGTVEETVILSNTFNEMMKSFAAGMGSEEGEGQENLVDEAKLREKARAMGEGVELMRAEAVTTDTGSGFKAVYSFRDINKLRVNQNPSENIPAPAAAGQGQAASPQELLQFRFTPGRTATLEIRYPQEALEEQPQEPEEAQEQAQESDPEMMQMMKELYKDMRLRLAVEVAGEIVDTNATYREGSRVTLMEVDFGKLLEDEAEFNKLMQARPQTVEEMKKILEDYPAIKLETQEKVNIRFK